MIEGLIGKKIGMTRVFTGEEDVPVTVIKTDGCYVVQKKTLEKDGYEAVQLGFEEKKTSRVNKPMAGHFKKAGTPAFYHLKEVPAVGLDDIKVGQKITIKDVFKEGDFVDVTGTSKGKGFAGVMKRWNFRGGPASHGSMHNRAPGSIGQSSFPSRVFKGMRMAGHHGAKRITTQNLKVVAIKENEGLLLVKGCVPGPRGAVLVIKKSVKKRKAEE